MNYICRFWMITSFGLAGMPGQATAGNPSIGKRHTDVETHVCMCSNGFWNRKHRKNKNKDLTRCMYPGSAKPDAASNAFTAHPRSCLRQLAVWVCSAPARGSRSLDSSATWRYEASCLPSTAKWVPPAWREALGLRKRKKSTAKRGIKHRDEKSEEYKRKCRRDRRRKILATQLQHPWVSTSYSQASQLKSFSQSF